MVQSKEHPSVELSSNVHVFAWCVFVVHEADSLTTEEAFISAF